MPRTPTASFLPSTGRLVRYRPPPEVREQDLVVRVDDGVADGGEVSMFYDPMIAKLVTWAPTRDAAIDAQVDALDQFVIDGISDNVDFLSALDAAPALSPRRSRNRLHRRGISRRLRRRAGRRAADRGSDGDRRHGRGRSPTSAPLEISDQLGERPHFPCERVVQDRRRRRAPGAHQALQGRNARGDSTTASSSTSSAAGSRGSGC